jgi:hypothetical protein
MPEVYGLPTGRARKKNTARYAETHRETNSCATTMDQREHPRRNLRFRPSMKGSVSKLGCEIRRGATLETRIFNENPHIRLKKPYVWLKYQCISASIIGSATLYTLTSAIGEWLPYNPFKINTLIFFGILFYVFISH